MAAHAITLTAEADGQFFANRVYQLPWDGKPIRKSPFLAFDTETEVVDLTRNVPRLALLTATNGAETVVVRPEQVADFVKLHHDTVWVGFNSAFDFWVIESVLPGLLLREAWWRVAETGRLRDAMLLDFLVKLATPGATVFEPRDLGTCSKEWLSVPINKEDPYRMRFGELIGTDWSQAHPDFFRYAVKDTLATHALYATLYHEAIVRAGEHGIGRALTDQFGVLTETLQVRASIALMQIGRNGMRVDLEKVATVKERLEDIISNKTAFLKYAYPKLIEYYKVGPKKGSLKVNKATGVVNIKQEPLRAALLEAVTEAGQETDDLPVTPTGKLSTALDVWRDRLPESPLVANWGELMDNAKLLQFLVKLTEPSIHPRYQPLVRTGRTSARGPNIQQMPREPWFRELFVAAPGHKLIIVDYAAIELRTLAAVCYKRFGYSVLGDQIKLGRDPHAYTAALLSGLSYGEFMEWKGNENAKLAKRFKMERQAAKAVNFGVPGGLGPAKLVAYAKANYGVSLSVEDAKAFREKLIREVYPELGEYLEDKPAERVARNLQTNPLSLPLDVEPWWWRAAERVVGADPRKANGSPYKVSFREQVWEALSRANQNPDIAEHLKYSLGSAWLQNVVFGACAVTLTGRVRANLGYTEERNTPFQGLAADGAKIALWELIREGFRVVAFVHDEIVVEVPDSEVEAAKRSIEYCMKESMSRVLFCDLPVEVETAVSERWVKG